MQTNALATERYDIAGFVAPGALSATERLTAAIDMGQYHRLMGIDLAGVLGASATSILAFKSATASGGSYDAISGKTTTLSKATDDDKQAIVNLRADELDAADDRYVKGSLTIANNTSDAAGLVLGAKRETPEADNALLSEKIAVLGVIDPDVYGHGAAVGDDWVDMSKFGQLMAVFMAGTISADVVGTVTFEQATSSAGAGAKAISGKSIVIGSDSPQDDNTCQALAFRADDLDVDGGFRYVRATLTVVDSASPLTGTMGAAVVLLGVDPREMPASDADLASVKSIVS